MFEIILLMVVAGGYARPDGMWPCSNCKYPNQRYAVICEASKQPDASKALPF